VLKKVAVASAALVLLSGIFAPVSPSIAASKYTLTLSFLLPIGNLDRGEYIIPDIKSGITTCDEAFQMLNAQKPAATMIHIFLTGQKFTVQNEKNKVILKSMAKPKYVSTPDGRYCSAVSVLKLPKAQHYDIYDSRKDLILEGFLGKSFVNGKASKQLSPWK
jgi:hypothetical protein